MRKIASALAVLACLCSGAHPAWAQVLPATDQDARIMEACLKEQVNPVVAKELAYQTCVQQAAYACMEEPGGSSTLGIMDCFERETTWWDTRLNQTYKLLQENLPAEQFARLREVQRSWLAFRNTQCQFLYDFYYPGSIRQTYTAMCHLRETARRAIDLHMFAVYQKLATP
jgi:uncharacterized protein YecT (DUF1311 family)